MKPAQMMYASRGYTLANEGFSHVKDLKFLQTAAADQRMVLDIVAWPGFTEIRAGSTSPSFPSISGTTA